MLFDIKMESQRPISIHAHNTRPYSIHLDRGDNTSLLSGDNEGQEGWHVRHWHREASTFPYCAVTDKDWKETLANHFERRQLLLFPFLNLGGRGGKGALAVHVETIPDVAMLIFIRQKHRRYTSGVHIERRQHFVPHHLTRTVWYVGCSCRDAVECPFHYV